MAYGPNTMKMKINTIRMLEERAQKAQRVIWDSQAKWETLLEQVKGTPEWKAYCMANGRSEDPDFGDILA